MYISTSTPFSILVSVLFDDMRSRNIAHIRCILKGTRTWCATFVVVDIELFPIFCCLFYSAV